MWPGLVSEQTIHNNCFAGNAGIDIERLDTRVKE
jgi:hypothetical protein